MSEGPSQRRQSFGWASILIVDDDEQNRQLLARAIARFGSQVRHAADGEAALEAMATYRTDLVLLDIFMPGLDGFGVLERMRANPELRDLAVIVVSSADDMESIVRAIQLGAEDYIPKPCPLEVLRARIGGTLERMSLQQQLAPGSSSPLPPGGERLALSSSKALGRGGGPTDPSQSADRLRELLTTTVRLSTLVAAELPAESPLRAYLAEIERAGREAGTIAQQLSFAEETSR